MERSDKSSEPTCMDPVFKVLKLMQVESEEGELLGEVKAVHDFVAGPVLEVS